MNASWHHQMATLSANAEGQTNLRCLSLKISASSIVDFATTKVVEFGKIKRSSLISALVQKNSQLVHVQLFFLFRIIRIYHGCIETPCRHPPQCFPYPSPGACELFQFQSAFFFLFLAYACPFCSDPCAIFSLRVVIYVEPWLLDLIQK